MLCKLIYFEKMDFIKAFVYGKRISQWLPSKANVFPLESLYWGAPSPLMPIYVNLPLIFKN